MSRLLKYFLVGFSTGFALFFLAFSVSHSFQEAAVMAVVAGGVYSLFCVGFMRRLMKTRVLKVTPANKDPEKGLVWYSDEIRQQLYDMRFIKVGKSSTFEVFHPVGLNKVWERKVELSIDPYEVKVTGSRFVIRVLSDLVEIKPVEENKGEPTPP